MRGEKQLQDGIVATGNGRWISCMGTGHWQNASQATLWGCTLTLSLELGDDVDAITHAEHKLVTNTEA
jgi:hypothetical protein